MPKIMPFKGVVYNKGNIRDISAVVAPPYDIIPEEMQDALYRKNSHNIVRLILGKIKTADTRNNNRYTRAKDAFEVWLEKNVLVRDSNEAFYVYAQEYEDNGKRVQRIGFIALMELDLGKKKILAHENTLRAPKIDRLDLMRSVKANLSPIFVLYEDGAHKILNILKSTCRSKKPFIDIKFDNVRHKVWRLDDKKALAHINEVMRRKDVFIADGHHRYEVACNYSREIRAKDASRDLKANSRFMMAYFVESDDKMLTILPTHRLVKKIGALKNENVLKKVERFFYIEKKNSLNSLITRLYALKSSCAFGMYMGGNIYYLLRLKGRKAPSAVIKNKPDEWKRLDVTVLHLFLLEHVLGIRDDEKNIEYVKDAGDARDLVDKRKYKIAFFLNPTKVSEVKKIARLGECMPRKATYFYPKPLSGLVINRLTN